MSSNFLSFSRTISALAVPKAYAIIQFNETAAGDANEAVVKMNGIVKAIEDKFGCNILEDWLFDLSSPSGSSGMTIF